VPNPRGVDAALTDKLTSAVKSMSRRTVGRLIEEQLMDCHSPERARRIAAGPLVLSEELRQDDRRVLDDAVFELLGVSDAPHVPDSNPPALARELASWKLEPRAASREEASKLRGPELARGSWKREPRGSLKTAWTGTRTRDGVPPPITAARPARSPSRSPSG
jgi:hypothetical protein